MDNKPSVQDQLLKVFQQDKSEEDLYHKQKELYYDKIDNEYKALRTRKKIAEKTNSIQLDNIDLDRIDKIAKDNDEYLKQVKNACVFFNNKDFKGKIPYFAKNVILMAATSGEGKSTISANLTYHAIMQKQRVLVITNEEHVADVYNRVTALLKGWSYSDHSEFTAEQRETFSKFIKFLSKRITVIDDQFNDELGQTTTIEGITTILNSVIQQQAKFDVIIIDYYQNVYNSITNPQKQPWQVQEDFCRFLNNFKNIYKGPIILLAQKKAVKEENMSFKEAIEGRKMVLNVATCAIEVKADRQNYKTDFIIKKSRFNGYVGETIEVGFDRGLYVPYTKDFKIRAHSLKIKKENTDLLSKVLSSNETDE